jgi:hypothetical protein
VSTSSLISRAPSRRQSSATNDGEPGCRGDDAHVRRRGLGDDGGDAPRVRGEDLLQRGTVVVGHDERLRRDRPRARRPIRQREGRQPRPGGGEQTVGVPVVVPANFTSRSRPVAPRARRMAVMVASVPETSRAFCTAGTRRTISSTSSASAGVGAPNDSPRAAAA